MQPRSFLRAEGLGNAVLAVGALYLTDTPLWLVVALALAPDIGMLGYLHSPRVGSVTYNLLHWYPLPVAVAAAGIGVGVDLAVWTGLIWVAHIGLDRAIGYGMKFEDAFDHTHLSTVDPTP